MSAAQQSAVLREKITQISLESGEATVTHFAQRSNLTLIWIEYFRNSVSRHTCDEILDGCKGSLIEGAACLSLGLVRSAIFAIRLQYELFIAWIYFNDHPVEWKSTLQGDSDFPMRKNNLDYIAKYDPNFKKRLSVLEVNCTRSERDPYRILSSFVHGSNVGAMPAFQALDGVVEGPESVQACLALEGDVSEFLSDIAAAWLADRWHDLPVAVKEDLSQRLSPAKLKEFCK